MGQEIWTREELTGRGYAFVGFEKCKGPNCGAKMEVWRTPANTILVMDALGVFQNHFITCRDRGLFKRERGPRRPPVFFPQSGNLFE